jgi:pyruvate dehydrogenase E2 component (dihydrolipoamide acetyltransferase)
MATKVHMEALSPTMEEGQIIRWLKAEGDSVANGDIIAEIETDKATMELVARGDGILRAILLGEGSTAPVGEVIAVIAAEDEDIGDIAGSAGSGAGAGAGAGGGDAAPESGAPGGAAPTPVTVEESPAQGADEVPAGGRVKASPLARRLAEASGVDLGAVKGSGPGGRVVKKDVEAAASAPPAPPAAASTSSPLPLPAAGVVGFEGPDYEDVPLSQMRKTIARRLTESIGPVPHFFLTVDVDMARTMQARASVNRTLEPYGRKISVNDMIIRATAAALRLHPAVNAAWTGEAIRRHNRVHIGVAVAVEDGLITPVIRDADRKGLAQIGEEVRELAGRARDKRLQPEEYTGATFSISNLGMFGIHEFTAVINPPEAGILAVGGVEETAVVVDGNVEVRPRMKITMSCDHRVIDGATGAKFLATLREMLEEPATILV